MTERLSSIERLPIRRNRYTQEFKQQVIQETFVPGRSIARVAREHGINANPLSTWRRLSAQDLMPAEGATPQVLPIRIHDSAPAAACSSGMPVASRLELELPKGLQALTSC